MECCVGLERGEKPVSIVEQVDYASGEVLDAPQSDYVICLVTHCTGKVRSRLDGGRAKDTLAAPGLFLPIVPPGVGAEFQFNAPMRHLILRVAPQRLKQTPVAEQTANGIERLFESEFSDPLLVELAKGLLAEAADPFVSSALIDTFCLMLRRTAAVVPARPVARAALNSAQTRRISGFLNANLGNKLTLADIARHQGLSERHMADGFKAATGTTLRQHLIALRVARARQLLQDGTLQLTEIADATGFADQAHLTATFTRHVGMPPARFRRIAC